jgi:hypothetical protein
MEQLEFDALAPKRTRPERRVLYQHVRSDGVKVSIGIADDGVFIREGSRYVWLEHREVMHGLQQLNGGDES